MNLEYTLPDVAFEEAGRRLRDPVLQEKVRAYLGGIWPAGFEDVPAPRAVFAPYIAKGSMTEVNFLNKAAADGFDTLVATYRDTEYVTANSGIVDCYRAPFLLPKGQQWRPWVVPEAERLGRLGTAATIYSGLEIVGYWRGIRNAVLEENELRQDDAVVDFGGWYALQARRFGWEGERSKARFYYMALMGLYASGRAVLFDTPPTAFATDVMLPAYTRATRLLGAVPLLTNVLQPAKRDWVDVSFLGAAEAERLQTSGRVSPGQGTLEAAL